MQNLAKRYQKCDGPTERHRWVGARDACASKNGLVLSDSDAILQIDCDISPNKVFARLRSSTLHSYHVKLFLVLNKDLVC